MGTPKAKEQSFFYRIMVLLLAIFLGSVFTFFLYFVAQVLFLGATMESLSKNTMNVTQIQLLQFIQTICIFILPPFILCRFFKTSPVYFLSLKSWNTQKALLGILSIIAIIPLLNLTVAWNQSMHLPESMKSIELWMKTQEQAAKQVTDLLMSGTSVSNLILNLFLVAVLAGVGEELLFRGMLLRIVRDSFKKRESKQSTNWQMHLSIWIVAIIFSAIHLQFYGFIPRMLLGAWFGYLLYWTGSIWVPILAHFTNNALSTLVMFGINKGQLSNEIDQIGMGSTFWTALLSLVFLYRIALYYISSSKITIKKAETSDIHKIHELASKIWFKTYKHLLSKEQMDYMFEWMYSEKALQEQMIDKGHVFYIAYEGKKPLGYVSIEKQSESLFHLQKIYIAPSSQGKGLGEKLLLHAFEHAKSNTQLEKLDIELNVNRGNKAYLFYQKMGMHVHDQGDFDIGNGYYMNDYIMRISLSKN